MVKRFISILLVSLCFQAAVSASTPLHEALRQQDYEAAKHLILQDATDVNSRDQWGFTPLHLSQDAQTTALLIRRGADVNAQGAGLDPNFDFDPTKFAHMGNANTILSKIKEFGEDYAPLHLVDNVAVATVLIENGANIEAQTTYQETPLHKVKTQALAALLLAHGANINARTAYNKTPLHSAVDKTKKEGFDLVELLVEKGADVNASDNHGNTALHYIRQGNFALAKYLIGHGADTTLSNADGDLPICYAIADNKTELVVVYLTLGKGILSRCSGGRNLIQYSKEEAWATTATFVENSIRTILAEFAKSKQKS